MNEKIRYIFIQILLIATGIVFVMSIEGIVAHLGGQTFVLQWYHPLSILASAVLCSIPSLFLLWFDRSKRKFIVGLIIHFILLYAIIIGMGYIFKWYMQLDGFLFLSGSYVFVYCFVWGGALWLCKRDANAINGALNEIRDDE